MSFVLVEFRCEPCGEQWESLEERPAPARVLHVACGKDAERIISAVKAVVASAKPTPVTRGKSDPLPSHRSVDTRALADGMQLHEWRAKRRSMWRNEKFKQVKRELG